MRVIIPSPLHSYTNRQSLVDSQGDTVQAVIWDLERQFPGIRFRMVNELGLIRQHLKIFVNRRQISDLDTTLQPSDEITIVQAFSGG